MARQQLKQYVFSPAGAGVGTVKIPGNYSNAQILTILNTTVQTFIYNFADTTLGATITWSSTPDANYPQSIDGVTTITLTTSTSTMSASDKLAIYVEVPYQTQRPFATDAVERLRVANPLSLIDADFEYGLQNTKWQSLFTNNDNPSVYEVPGSDSYANVVSYCTFTGNAFGTAGAVILSNERGANVNPNWTNGDFAVTWNPHVASPPPTTYLTANVVSLNQRTLTVASSNSFAVGDSIIMVNLPLTNNTTVATATLTAGTTTLNLTANSNIISGTMLMLQTNTANLWELVSVTTASTTTMTVVRNRLGTNSGNVTIGIGNAVRVVGQVEIGYIDSIDSFTSMTIDRSWLNTVAWDNMNAGTVIQKINWDAAGASGTNVEIIQSTTAGNNTGNIHVLSRAAMGTSQHTGSQGQPWLRLTGVFTAGSVNLPLVGINLPGHTFTANAALSTSLHNDTNSEGQYQVVDKYTNYITYYPRKAGGFHVGYQLNRWDTFIRYAGFYGTASLPPVTLSSDGATPSTITATAAYAHGINPGTPILVNLSSGTNAQYGSGSFTVLSIPTPTTFTYLAKSGAAISGSVAGNVYVRPSAFFVHRSSDGGVNLGTGSPHHGAMAARQSKKYFRYQSGKGLMWTSGTLLGANYDTIAVSASGTGASGNTITITTDGIHGLQIGANISLQGISTSGYNGYYIVQSITGDATFTVNVTATLGNVTPVYIANSTPKVVTVSWVGAAVRAGMYDDQNGIFWENTGVKINVCQRNATTQLIGYISVETATNLATGDGTCKFTQQLVKDDKIVIRGMTHTVTSVIDDNQITISPVWRGLTNQTRVKPTKIVERRIPQNQWNVDPLDGTGQSGFLLDATKMQMLMIQYTWYGAGFIDFGVRGPLGNYIFCHRFMNNNTNYEAYMRSGNLPARYSADNRAPYALLANAIPNGSQTEFWIQDSTQFPTPTPTSPVYVMIDNEVLKCTGITQGTTVAGVTPAAVTGVTRAATFSLWQDGANKSFSMGSAAAHSANVSVNIISATVAPSLNHWGSAVILDGGFDTDRGYAYTYSVANVIMPIGTNANNTTITAFAMRLAPAVSNQIPGDLGVRDLVNRAQLILNNMIVNFSGANVSTTTGARYLIEGILNPNNVSTTSTTWSFLYNAPYNARTNPSGTIQPSYTQVASGNIAATASGQQISYLAGTYATGGERLFAIPVNYTNSGQLDLSTVKQLGNSGIPGYNTYPDGPELLALNITALVPTSGVNASGEIQIQWSESQA